MSDGIKAYRENVEKPWGKLFYELIYRQLDIPDERRLKLLDMGAGFCITADHYAEHHDVTALEPNAEMYGLRRAENSYTLITQGAEHLQTFEDGEFDAAICHNVLEYVEDREAVLKQLARVIKPGGLLSVVKHNLLGRVMSYAVLNDDPGAALGLLTGGAAEGSAFGDRQVYDNSLLTDVLSGEMELVQTCGVRTFFGLSSNNEVKYNSEWYSSMLELETRAGTMDEYKRTAFFNHLIFRKRII